VTGRSQRRALVGGLLVVATTATLTAIVRTAGPAIYCGDGWFHVRYATILRDHGIARTFPWWQESFLRDRFTDFNLLYHLLLIPFTWMGELTGARVLAVLAAAFTMGALWWTLRVLRVPWPWLFALGALAASPDFAYRLTYSRPFVLALGLGFLGTAMILRGRALGALIVTFVYAHTHCSFHFLPCLALLHDAQRTVPAGTPLRSRFATTGATLAGAALGLVVSPYVPNDFSFWWTANVGVLEASWSMGRLLRVGTEMLPVGAKQLLLADPGVFAVTALALYGMTHAGRVSDEARTLLVTALGFFGLTLLSQRFIELWTPYALLFAGVVVRDLAAGADPSAWVRRRAARLAAVAGVVLVAVGLAAGTRENVAAAAVEDPPLWRPAARWMKANVPAGETIFHLGWDEFPELFFEDTTHRYLIGQDATFFYATSPERFRLWAELAHGVGDDAWTPVRRTFGCRFAFIPRRYVSFLRLARRDPRFTEVWSDANAVVLRAADDGTTVAMTVRHGWRADPSRTLFGAPLPGEPGGPEAPGSPIVPAAEGFVDLARVAGVPPGLADACAVVSGEIASDTARRASLGVTTDDEVKVYVNGEPVYAHSPYRTPPPGSPGGPPLPLEEIFRGAARGPHEVHVPVTLRVGRNPVVVKDCRAGEDFGFVLRCSAR
jgi:hypothetical protein